ncbi:MAG: hypothetical protein IPM16_04750 [Chloroflexi bacterium]|nr:hypothetical protein [Chloroflexota bacterium]
MDDELFTTEMAYDPAGRVTTIHHHHDVSGVPQTLARFDYTVDARGNRTQAVEQRQPSGGGSLQPQTHVYTYDGVERVTGATTYPNATPTGTPIRTFAYGYDVAGNRTSAALNGTPTSYTYNTRNQLTSDGAHTFSYDKNGNRISDGTLSTVWDRAGRMLSYDGHSYAYDGEGRRIAQTAAGSTTRYVLDVQRGLPAVIGAKAGSDITHYMHGPLGMFAQRNPDSSWDWMLHDGLGSVRGVFDGTLQSAAEYDPFGEPLVAPMGTAYGFTGELTDGNGLVYLRARYLAPSLGTFASRDPWRGSASAPRTWNGYAWVEGNVVNRGDPGGMQSATPTPTPTVSCQSAPQPQPVSTPPPMSTPTAPYDPTRRVAGISEPTITPVPTPRIVSTPGPTPLEWNRLVEYYVRKWNRFDPADCDSRIQMCVTLSDAEFAATLRAIITHELPGGHVLEGNHEWFAETLYRLELGLASDTTLGAANLRPSTVKELFEGRLGREFDPRSFDPTRLRGLRDEWEAINEDKNAFADFMWRPEVFVDLAAANLYRGTLRMNRDGQAPSIFSMSMWYNEGIYAAKFPLASSSSIDKATGYANAVLDLILKERSPWSNRFGTVGDLTAFYVLEEARYVQQDLRLKLLWSNRP